MSLAPGAAALLGVLLSLVPSGPSWGARGEAPDSQHDHNGGAERLMGPMPREGGPPPQVVVLLAVTDPSEARRAAEELARQQTLVVSALYQLSSMEATLVVFEIPDRRRPDIVISLLKQAPGVIDADVDAPLEIQAPPLRFQYAPRVMGADRVHPLLRGRNILVAMIDTAIDAAHKDLQGTLAAQVSLVEGDTHPGPGVHGTAEAGIIAARGDATGMLGIAPEAQIVALEACVPKGPGAAEATCLAHRVARGVDVAVQQGAPIINMSVGGPPNRIVTRLVLQALIVHGRAVVAAAGNNGPNGPALYPAALPGVIATGATDDRDAPYGKSNLGRHLSILAPGVDVISTLPGDRYAFVTGTSYAAAHVSGVLALLMEARRDLGIPDVMEALKKGAVQVGGVTVGRVDVCRSLTLMGRPDVCR